MVLGEGYSNVEVWIDPGLQSREGGAGWGCAFWDDLVGASGLAPASVLGLNGAQGDRYSNNVDDVWSVIVE